MENKFVFNWDEYYEIAEGIFNEVEDVYGGDKIIDINKVLNDSEGFKNMYRHIYGILLEGFEIEKIRKYKVKLTFNKKDYVEVELRHLIINMIFLRAFVELEVDVELDESYLFEAYNINNKLIKKYMDEKIILPFREEFTDTEERFMFFNKVLHDVIFRLNKIPRDFNELMGLTMSLEESFIKVSKENPRFNEIIRTKIPEGMQPKEIENLLEDLKNEEIEILKNTPNCLQPMLLAGTGIKEAQLREMSVSGGMKSDLLGNTIPIPINTNYIVGGLNNVINYYLDAQAGRKSLIANKEKMGSSGHFSLLLKLACVGTYISETTKDCHTSHTVKLTIKDKKFLNMCVGRYYRLPAQREFRILKSSDTHLIGRTLMFRDPSTCACKDGVCPVCYGAMSSINKGMDVGVYAATIISRPLGQNILSTKHLNTTNSEIIEFVKDFHKIFKLQANQIQMLKDSECDLDLTQYELIFDNIIRIDELADNVDFNKFVPYIKVRNIKNHDEVYEIVENDGKELFIHPELDGLLRNIESDNDGVKILPLSDITDETLFTINIANNELTKPLKEMDKLLNGSYFSDDTFVTVDLMEQTFIELMIKSNIGVTSIHAATMLRSFVRDQNNLLERPDFSKMFVDYVVLGLRNALANNPAITTSLAYDYLKKQLVTYTSYMKKDASPLDVLFRKTLA